jgi:hypothetical protein
VNLEHARDACIAGRESSLSYLEHRARFVQLRRILGPTRRMFCNTADFLPSGIAPLFIRNIVG